MGDANKKVTAALKRRTKYRRDPEYRKYEQRRSLSRYRLIRSDPVLWREHLDKQNERRRRKKAEERGE